MPVVPTASTATLSCLVRVGARGIVGLAALHMLSWWWRGGTKAHPWVNLNGEGNLPTGYAAMLLLGAALGAARGAARRPAVERCGWAALAAGLLVMAADELLQGHEAIGRAANRQIFEASRWEMLRPWAQRFKATWVIVVAPAVVLWAGLVIARLRGAWAGAGSAWRQMMLGAGCFVAGAFGLELIKYLLPQDLPAWGWQLRYVLEESLEMSGSLLMLSALWQRAATEPCSATSTH